MPAFHAPHAVLLTARYQCPASCRQDMVVLATRGVWPRLVAVNHLEAAVEVLERLPTAPLSSQVSAKYQSAMSSFACDPAFVFPFGVRLPGVALCQPRGDYCGRRWPSRNVTH